MVPARPWLAALAPSTGMALLALMACGPATPEPVEPATPVATAAPAAPPAAAEEPAPVLRTGSAAPVDGGTVQGSVVGRFDDDGMETLAVSFQVPPAIGGATDRLNAVPIEPDRITIVDPTGAALPSSF